MKKKWLMIICCIAVCGLLGACADKTDKKDSTNKEQTTDKKEVVEITEKMYVSFINDIYTNRNQYLGKTIRIEGMFKAETISQTGKTYYYVYRTGPGCCGNDGAMCGFEFTTKGTYPKDNEWIQVEGVLDSYEEESRTYLTLKDAKVTVKKERGTEVVSQ